jgi:hypothetical protein
VPAADWSQLSRRSGGRPGLGVSNDLPALVAHNGVPPPSDGLSYNLLALDGVPLAWTRPHGHAMTWFGGAPGSVSGARLDQPRGELA